VDLLGVDHDDVVAHVNVRGVERAGLAGENAGGVRREAAEGLAGGVEDEPLALDVFSTRNRGGLVQVHCLLPGSAVFVEQLPAGARRCLQSMR